jgi:stress-induced morphogen
MLLLPNLGSEREIENSRTHICLPSPAEVGTDQSELFEGVVVNKDQVKARILEGIPDAEIAVNEFSGGDDHYAVLIVSPIFAGKKLLARHRLILDLFQAEIATGEVHALTMKTHTPDEWVTEKPKQMMFS